MTHDLGLPPPRRPGGYRIDLVCMGNICRSPMAEVVLRRRAGEAGLGVEVVSSGTGGWHVGEPMDRRAAALLTAHGYDALQHRAQQLDPAWLAATDLALAMDEDNLAALHAAAPAEDVADGRVRLFREFDPLAGDGDRAVPDPYYGGDDGFSLVLSMVERTCTALVAGLVRAGAGR